MSEYKGPFIVSNKSMGFGDKLLASYFASILNRNNIKAFLNIRSRSLHLETEFYECVDNEYADCRYNKSKVFHIRYGYGEVNNKKMSILEQVCYSFLSLHGIDIKVGINYIPVKYIDIPEIKSYDIAMGTKCGEWNRYREWPYFEELKKRLMENGISYIDMDEQKMFYMKSLNCVKKAKLYVGIETGMSHFVSQFANGKALILQSGFEDFRFWCNYNYDYLYIPVPCRICHKNTDNRESHGHKRIPDPCNNDHKCMKDMSVDAVFNKIIDKLKM